MRLLSCIPFAVLTFLPLVAPAQVPVQASPLDTPAYTVLDALYDDPDYVSLVKLLQRAKLIPTLNRLKNFTFFAPTNDAIKHHSKSNPLWEHALSDGVEDLGDNVQLLLRQQLFYHLLNHTLTPLPAEQSPKHYETLLYPRNTPEPPSREPPPYPPWMPVQNGTLGTDPQRLRLTVRDETVWVGTDAAGKGGVKVVKPRNETANGVLFGVHRMVEMPPDLATVISRRPELSYFNRILTPGLTKFLKGTSSLTVFLPEDDAWAKLPSLERLYLESEFASDDLERILNMHAVLFEEPKVKWSDSFADSPVKLPTIDGPELDIVPQDRKITVSGADLTDKDIYASNGVVHTVSSLLLPPDAIKFTPEKYLLALNCTQFVSLVHSVNLTHLINDTSTEYTILAPRDDVITMFGDNDLPHRGSEELKRVLQYHFIPGRWASNKFADGMLVETALTESGLGGGRQVLPVQVTDGIRGSQGKAIRFAGAGVMGDEVEIANHTVIYFLSRALAPPVDAIETASPELDYSTFMTRVFSVNNLAHTLKTTPKTTVLIPPNSAFRRLGLLVSTHLAAATPSSKADLERVIRHHTLAGVHYADSLVNGSQRTFQTLEGSDISVVRRGSSRSVIFTPSGGWAGMQSGLTPRDMLTKTGVIHEITDLLIPRSVELTVGKLVKAAKASTMTTMVVKAGFEWVLNGTAPPEGSPWADRGLGGAGWTLLCPTDDAFKEVNLTELYSDDERLRAIVAQHLIPTPAGSPSSLPLNSIIVDTFINNRPLPLEDSATYTTLHSTASAFGDIIVRVLEGSKDEDGIVVGIKGARGNNGAQDWAHVVQWGRSTTGGGTGGVVQIDRLLFPYEPSWYVQYGAPLAVGGGGILLIGLFFWGVRWVWRRDTTEATYEPVGGFRQYDDDDT